MATSNQVFVSPGVFTREIDQSFLPTGVTDIGAAIIGVTEKGPAFVPTKVANFSEYRQVFGGYDTNLFVPYAAASYLRNGSPLTVCRVLGLDSGTTSGYGSNIRSILLIGAECADKSAGMQALGTHSARSGSLILAEVYESEGASDISSAGLVSAGAGDKGFWVSTVASSNLTGSYLTKTGIGATTGTLQQFAIVHKNTDGVVGTFNCSLNPSSDQYIKKVLSTKPMEPTYDDSGNKHWIHIGRVWPWAIKGVKTDAYGAKDPASELGGAFNTASLSSYALGYAQFVGGTFNTARSGSSTSTQNPITFTGKYVTPRTPTILSQPFGATGSNPGREHELFYFETLNDGTNANFDVKVELRNPIARSLANDGTDYGKFDILVRNFGDTDISPEVLESFGGVDLDPDSDDYIGRRIGDSKVVYNSSTNKLDKQGSPYGENSQVSSFVRVIVPRPGVTPPTSLPWGHYGYPTEYVTGSIWFSGSNRNYAHAGPNFGSFVNNPFLRKTIAQQDKNGVPDQRVCWGVEWENLQDVGDSLRKIPGVTTVTLGSTKGIDNKLWGNNSYASNYGTLPDGALTASLQHFSMKWISGSSGQEVYTATRSGIPANRSYAMPTHLTSSDGALDFSNLLAAPGGAPAASLANKNLKFSTAFYGGWDGIDPGYGAEAKYVASAGVVRNVPFRFNTKDSNNSYIGGTQAFRSALDMMSNDEIFDFNLLFIPGVSDGTVTTKGVEVCEERGDALYIVDPKSSASEAYGGGGASNVSISGVKTQAQGFNSNYAAVYYPWVKIQDPDTNAFLLVPPTVEIPGVMSFNDRVGHPWFAPAGFNRGALDNVVEAYDRLTKDDRDDLYNNKVNPIGTFSGQGVVVFGQKTLQTKASALDRINVRRLLLFTRKLIASTARFLVFEPNNVATRQKFVNLVNPILDNIRRNQGLERFKVVCDESINTPDVIDRNILKGQIYVQPTRTAEFISIDFYITRTGASFDEV